jgi:hypothetical protein
MSVFWYYRTTNQSPLVTAAFLARQRRLLLPMQYAREHENTWTDGADRYVPTIEVDDAMDGSWAETPRAEPGVRYKIAVDIGSLHDPTVITVGSAQDGLICIDKLVTLQGSREQPVQMTTVESIIVDLAEVFQPEQILIESWQGISVAQSLQRLRWPAVLATPTAKSNAEQWSVLGSLFASRRIVLPVHARLREELVNLSVEMTPLGIKVVDRGSVHQDHAVTVRMLAAALVTAPERVMVW